MATVSIEEMQSVYYGCNPRPHSEKAYQRGDPAAPTAAHATVVGPSGKVIVLVTTVHNRNPQGRAEFSLVDGAQREVARGTSDELPWFGKVEGLTPGTSVYIRPRTIGTMAKALSWESFEEFRGGCASWKSRRP